MLKEIENGDYRRLFVSLPRFDESDWPVYLFVKLEYLEEHGEEIVRDLGRYHCEVFAVSVAACSRSAVRQACESMGLTLEQFDALDEVYRHVVLADYGVRAHIWQDSGNNSRSLLRAARQEVRQASFLFGFAMDMTQNRIGDSGWESIKGNLGKGWGEMFRVEERLNGFELVHIPSGQTHWLGDGVDVGIVDGNGKPVLPGTADFADRWAAVLNADRWETLEAYFPELAGKRQGKGVSA